MPAYALFMLVTLGGLQASPATAFDGNWTAEYRGTTYVRLSLRTVDGITSGTLSLGNLEFGKDGTVVKATDAPKTPKPIFDLQRRGNVLAFAWKDSEDTDRFELTLAGDSLELTFILSDEDREELAAEGIPVLKAMKLTKQK
jgi:hypothetical protein